MTNDVTPHDDNSISLDIDQGYVQSDEQFKEDDSFGESALNSVANKKMKPGSKAFLFFLLLFVVLSFGLVSYKAIQKKDERAEQNSVKRQVERVVPKIKIAPLPEDPEPVTLPPVIETPVEDTSSWYAPPIIDDYQDYSPPTPIEPDPVQQRRLSSPLNKNSSVIPASSTSSNVHNASFGASSSESELSSRLKPAKLQGSSASILKKRSYMITQGTKIPCTLESRIVSDLPGLTTCIISRDVYSTNGKVVLLEKGSKVVGNYDSGIKQGQARIFVLWTRVETPKGVIINVDSPGAGPLAEGGLSGFVDNHYVERFGGAILISLTGDLGNFLTASASDSSEGTVTFANTSAGAEEAVTEALRNSINIPPTLYKNQGDRIMISVARDMDFTGVYNLRLLDE